MFTKTTIEVDSTHMVTKTITYYDEVEKKDVTKEIEVEEPTKISVDALSGVIPDVLTQCAKTPVMIDKAVESVDEKGAPITVMQRSMMTVDEIGKDGKPYARIVMWSELKGVLPDVEKEGRWGLGCPYSCGRFWEFKPSKDFAAFVPEDGYAIAGTDIEGNATDGYLHWKEGDDASVFICDRCGGMIQLKKPLI